MTGPSSPLTAGMIVAETYDVERLLGKGGMGEVWLARHLRLAGKQVAIKVLRALAQNPSAELLSRFRREAEIAARLEHPNIVQVLDFNQLPSGEPYLVMEFLKGESLADRLRASGGSMHPTQVQGIVLQVGSALQTAHAAGVVHRDLKPDNIFLVPTALGDQIKVLDFGISKLAQASTLQTTEQTLLGTPLYMSPEQALGQNRDTTAQSDIFSLGSICYELLTGTAPFVAESIAQVVFRIAYQPHVPLQQIISGVPANVVNAVEHALIKDRAARTPNIATFIRELTGQELTDTGREPNSGVYQPGMQVTDSLMNNATVAPSGAAPASKVTPFSRSMAPVSRVSTDAGATAAKPSSAKWVLAGLVAVAVLAAGVVVAMRQPGTAQPVRVIDAGHAISVVEAVIDAGPAVAVVEPVIDAGVAVAVIAPPPTVKVTVAPEPPMPEGDKRFVDEMKALKRDKLWEKMKGVAATARNSLKSTAGKRAVVLLALEADCALKDISSATSDYRRLNGFGESAALNSAIPICHQYLPDWDPR